jgi:hypothetical protein
MAPRAKESVTVELLREELRTLRNDHRALAARVLALEGQRRAPATSGKAVPPHISTAEFAEAMRWTTRRARAFLKRREILEKNGGQWGVARAVLKDKLPDHFEDVQEHFGRAPK